MREPSSRQPSIRSKSLSLLLTLTAVNAAIYAAIGALWTIFPLMIFGVRFWPQVFAPATFAILFGPWVGGVGAAIGIFLADVIYGSHDAVLSLLVGVPANFVGFFVVGWLTNRHLEGRSKRFLQGLSLLIQPLYAAALVVGLYFLFGVSTVASPASYLSLAGLIVVIVIIFLIALRNRWADFEVAASIGLGIGTAIIGVGLVLYSMIFGLPLAEGLGTKPLGVSFVYLIAASSYFTEIPFMVILTPPVAAACRAAFPSLKAIYRRQSEQ